MRRLPCCHLIIMIAPEASGGKIGDDKTGGGKTGRQDRWRQGLLRRRFAAKVAAKWPRRRRPGRTITGLLGES
jgi:hypothetical protein